MPSITNSLGPTKPQERIDLLDVLRGVALLGILTVNMALFANPAQYVVTPLAQERGLDAVVLWAIRWLAEGKFYALFSLLFGLGFTLQLARAEARGRRFGPVYLRRTGVLLVFGVLHGLLLWVGDILAIYAVLGLALLLFRKMRLRRVLIWAVILILLPTLFIAASFGLIAAGSQDPAVAVEIQAQLDAQTAAMQAQVAEAYTVYGQGSYGEITAQRARDLLFMWQMTLFIMPNILGMFLVGAYLGRRGILADPAAYQPLLRRLLVWGGGVGLVLNGVYATLIGDLSRTQPSGPLLIATVSQAVGAPLLMLAYVAGLALLWLRPAWQTRLRTFAPAGRMALTNYLMQSVICTLIYYGYGLGLFGQVGAALGLLLTLAIFAVEVVWSRWWLARFRFGPVEWLWRTLTYLRGQPMRFTGENTQS